ncbi:SAM-dependent methyltransferase [Leifsonia sp. ALI-44-B]|uniref:class I SAM-dependent methyltransferase n=1 Tax=Leifsonia sp. ALI-44-B TaxID=1933776 RepID=UPI00097C863B|nr:methyltransferase [Leifsonia sp. ALI-44-B]ONI61042.1 SAM-dependent methyltransferase [Leifsonia sp. ALI-44-B]
MPEFNFDALRRAPDVEAPNLFAVDPTDRFILDEAAELIEAAPAGSVVVANDRYGALALGAIAVHGARAVRVHQDAYSGELALRRNAEAQGVESSAFRSMDVEPTLVDGARVVLLQLPRQLYALDELAALIARAADPDVVVIAGGRIKHMSLAMNEVLSKYFGDVRVSRARQKSRLLIASKPRVVGAATAGAGAGAGAGADADGTTTGTATGEDAKGRSPLTLASRHDAALDLWVAAAGAAFGGTRVDIGTRFLLEFLPDMAPDAHHAIDLGCGTGILATSLARARPELRVTATDQSAAAVRSARETARLNGVEDRVEVVRDDALASQPDASADLIVLNPPFHVGSTVHAGIALKLFADASRVLKPGGELWTVWNTHLGYRPALERLVGPTEQCGRNTKFTVTRSRAVGELVSN